MYQDVYIINPIVRSISGRHTITEEDLGLPEGTLPPEDVASLGSLIVVDPESLRPGLAIRTAVQRLCESKGPKVGMGTAVPADILQSILDSLDDYKDQFEEWKTEFLANFRTKLEERVLNHPKYGHLIESCAPSEAYIKSRLSFEVDVYKLAVAADDPAKGVLTSTLQRPGNDIGRQLLRETATFSRKAFERTMKKAGTVKKRNLSPFRDTLLPKLRSFQLLDSRCRPIADLLESMLNEADVALSSIPKGKPRGLIGAAYDSFIKKLDILQHFDSLQAYAKDNTSNSFVGSAPSVTSTAPAVNTSATVVVPSAPTVPVTPSEHTSSTDTKTRSRGLPRRHDSPSQRSDDSRRTVNF